MKASKLLVHVPRIDPFDSKWVLRTLHGRFIHTYLPTLRTKHVRIGSCSMFLEPFFCFRCLVLPRLESVSDFLAFLSMAIVEIPNLPKYRNVYFSRITISHLSHTYDIKTFDYKLN